MQSKRLGLFTFCVGVFFLFVHTTMPFLWFLIGIPLAYPLIPTQGLLVVLPGFTPPIGAALMVVGAIVYSQEARR